MSSSPSKLLMAPNTESVVETFLWRLQPLCQFHVRYLYLHLSLWQQEFNPGKQSKSTFLSNHLLIPVPEFTFLVNGNILHLVLKAEGPGRLSAKPPSPSFTTFKHLGSSFLFLSFSWMQSHLSSSFYTLLGSISRLHYSRYLTLGVTVYIPNSTLNDL